MITVVSQDRTIILDVDRLELDKKEGKFQICYVYKQGIRDFLFFRSKTFFPLAEYRIYEDAKRVFKSYAAAISNNHKIFILPIDSRFFIEFCEELYKKKNEGGNVLF